MKGLKGEVDAIKDDVTETKTAVNRILDLLESKAPAAPVASPVEPEDIANVTVSQSNKAAPDKIQSNPEWEAIAKEILGAALDHTEVQYEKSGGIKFTVVVAKDFSNAPSQYLELTKQDRRTKEVSHEGAQGVEEWCRQIKANLARTTKLVRNS